MVKCCHSFPFSCLLHFFSFSSASREGFCFHFFVTALQSTQNHSKFALSKAKHSLQTQPFSKQSLSFSKLLSLIYQRTTISLQEQRLQQSSLIPVLSNLFVFFLFFPLTETESCKVLCISIFIHSDQDIQCKSM